MACASTGCAPGSAGREPPTAGTARATGRSFEPDRSYVATNVLGNDVYGATVSAVMVARGASATPLRLRVTIGGTKLTRGVRLIV